MKKAFAILAAALVALAVAHAESAEDAKASAKMVNEARREARAAVKLLRKEGFRSYELGNPETGLQGYFLKAAGGCAKITGTSGPCISENLAKLTALANAANEYAVLQGGTVRGRIVSTASSLSGQQLDNLVSSFERLVEKEIRGELIPCATFFRSRGGRHAARIYCIIDEDAAARARRHAMALALEEQSLAEKYGSLASDWVQEGFDRMEAREDGR